jgi:hypothetical protein
LYLSIGSKCKLKKGSDRLNIVSFGGGTNSTAMIIGMYRRKIPIDLIVFSDTGVEMPHTYQHITEMNKWLIDHKLPNITIVEYANKDGSRTTLEDDCINNKSLPSIAYGFKTCSLKHKKSVQEKYCNSLEQCNKIWKSGQKVNKFIGFDAGEENRKTNAFASNLQDKKYLTHYPLIDWEWYRDDCVKAIESEGLTLPGKSSCFFCPSMKKPEIRELKQNYPDLFNRAVAIEDNAKENLITVQGLGRNYSWKNFMEYEDAQVGMCLMYDPESDIPCGCYDG